MTLTIKDGKVHLDGKRLVTKLVKTEESGHWYTEDGQSAHVIIGANGKERNTTVADARKLRLLPSVTSVIGVVEKKNLTSWLVEQGILASLTLPRKDGEDLTEYAKRCVADSKEATSRAAQHGTRMHEEMEHILLGREHSKDPTLLPYIETFKGWAKENVTKTYWCEKCLVGNGYAGRCDALVELKGIGKAIIDLKNRKVNPKNNDPFYRESDCVQGSAYRKANGEDGIAFVSVVLASNDPSKIMAKQWEEFELEEGFEAFKSMLRIWAYLKNYVPPGMEL